MMSSLASWLTGQHLLVAGLGTVAASSAVYLLRSLPTKMSNIATTLSTSTLNVSSRNDFFNHIDGYLIEHVIPWTFRQYEPADRSDDDSSEMAYLNAGYGSGWGVWRGVPFSFSKTKDKGAYGIERTLDVKFFTRDRARLEVFIKDAVSHNRGAPRQKVYVSSGMYWERAADKRPRPLSTVYFASGLAEGVVARIEDFLSAEDWYLRRGIPYKLVILLHGPPGTGKTSLIHAVASHFKMDIDYITRLGDMGSLLSGRNNRRSIRVIEDIDTLANLERDAVDESDESVPPRRRSSRSDKSSPPNVLHDALNSLDGFTTQHGLVMFITSNYPEMLDPALLRPGRMDMTVEVGPLDLEASTRMFVAFYGESAAIELAAISHTFRPTTGAKLQSLLMRGDAASAASNLERLWSQEGKLDASTVDS